MTAIRTVRRLAVPVVLAAWAALWAVQADAAPRVALVVGNGGYDPANIARLANPVNDARLMASALERVGFDVSLVTDAGQDAMRRAIKAFGKRLRGAGDTAVGLFYYAGHGVETGGSNYLIPIGAEVESAMDLQSDAVPAQWVLSRMEAAGNRLNMVILDACRNNPYAGRVRGGGRGLARMDAPSGSLIAYSAAPGQVAADGEGENSPYTLALAEALVEPGMKVEEMFKRVRVRVEDETGRRGRTQTPWESSSLRGDFYFVAPRPAGGGAAPSPAAAAASGAAGLTEDRLAARAYEAAERVATVLAYEAVVRRFPDSIYAELARAQIGKLAGTQAIGSAGVPSGTDPPAPAPAETPARAGPAPREVEASLALERTEQRRIQQALASLGYAPGPADGLFGARTREAIHRYQGEKGHEATGYLTDEEARALTALGEEAARARAKEEEARRRQVENERRERERASRAPGRRFRDCEGCPELVVVGAGSYMMGSPSGEEGRGDDEGPVHRVRIGRPIAVGVTEVTRGEWRGFVRETGHSTGDSCWTYEDGEWKGRSGRSWRSPGYSQTDGHPVVCVSWEDAQEYVAWLSRKTGEGYRLLSEAEWEYVARGGTSTSRYWGEGESGQCRHANGADRTLKRRYGDWKWAVASCDDGHVHTAAVRTFSANGYGLHDVLGNVWEWVEDCWNEGYAGAPSNGSAWEGGDCARRVLRGGSWNYIPRDLRSAYRSRDPSGIRGDDVGFRVARTLN